MSQQGRPTKFSKEIADKICEQLSTSSVGLVTICAMSNMPSTTTVYNWLNDEKHKHFLETYTRAREAQAHFLADEIIQIADDTTEDEKIVSIGEDGIEVKVTDHEVIARSRLKVDVRKWLASKLFPKKYGDRIHTELSGETIIRVIPPGKQLPDQKKID